ncbi:MAG: nitroreductase family deazaflavin-dependent oxidoreductase [Pseudomonadales bacterium]
MEQHDNKPDQRPETTAEKERFSSGGRTWMLVLHGKWGLAIDNVLVWLSGYSLMTAQYAWANQTTYTDTLMIRTIGAKSKQLRTACLPYFQVGGDLVVRGSNGGGPTDPHWVHNIRANEHAWIRVNRKNRPVSAHVASGEERDALYAELCRMSSSTEGYQLMCAPRELPLVVLRDWNNT